MKRAKPEDMERLKDLGADRLASLLAELAQSDPAIKRRLKTELAALDGPSKMAFEVRKQIKALGRSTAFVDWRNRKKLTDDLRLQLNFITGQIATADIAEACDLIWRFIDIAPSVYNRCDDSSGTIGAVFREAVAEAGKLALVAKVDTAALADRIAKAILKNDFGQYDHIVPEMAGALGSEGLQALKTQMQTVVLEKKVSLPDAEREAMGWSAGGALYRDDVEFSSRKRSARAALQDIADALGDADGFAAQYDAKTQKVPAIAAHIAERLLKAGRAHDALKVLEAASRDDSDKPGWLDFVQPNLLWQNAMIATLDALGRKEDAQKLRWACFERFLSATHLRSYLKNLTDFEDIDAEERALQFTETHAFAEMALWFLVKWPSVAHSERLVMAKAGQWDGNSYETLSEAADALAGKYPLAASILLRAMIDYTLGKGISARYKHVARHLEECASLSGSITDWHGILPHSAYFEQLKKLHSKKSSFLALVRQ